MKRLFILMLLLLASPAWGATRYINPTCVENGDGTDINCADEPGSAGAYNNWPTPLTGGDIYLQKSGTTAIPAAQIVIGGNSVILSVYDASTGAIVAYPSALTATIDLNSSIARIDTQWYNSNIVRGLTIKNSTTDGVIFGSGQNNKLEYCTIENNASNGVYDYCGIGTIIKNSVIRNNGVHGVRYLTDNECGAVGQMSVYSNTINNNGYDGINITSYDRTAQHSTGHSIYSNTIYNNGDSLSHDGSGTGIYLIGVDTSNIYSNTIYNNDTDHPGASTEGYGIALLDSISNNIYRNTIYGNNIHQIEINSDCTPPCSEGLTRSDGNAIYNNLIYGAGYGTVAASFLIKLNTTGINTRIFNNIGHTFSYAGIIAGSIAGGTATVDNNTFYSSESNAIAIRLSGEGGGTIGWSIRNNILYTPYRCIIDDGSNAASLTVSNNLYFGPETTLVENLGGAGGDYTTINISTLDSAAVITDPLLNAAYGIPGNSPAKDAGAVLYTYAAHPGDYYGRKIYGAGPDIGAVEYEDHTPGGWFFEMFMPLVMKLCASTNAACYTQP